MDKVKKVVKKAEKKGWSLEKILKALAPIISWLTKGKIEKNTVLAIGGIVVGMAANVGPYEKADVAAVQAVDAGLANMEIAVEEQRKEDSINIVLYKAEIEALKAQASVDSASLEKVRWFLSID